MINNKIKDLLVTAAKKAIFLILIFAIYACSGHLDSHELYMSGHLDKSIDRLNGRKVLVYNKKEARNLVLEIETVSKLNKALAAYGYIPVKKLSDADYVLLFEYVINEEETISSTNSEYTLNTFTNRFESSRSTTTEAEYTKQLIIKLFSKDRLLNTSLPVWSGAVQTRSISSNLRSSMDYLIIAALEYFGQDTADEVVLTIRSDDERINIIQNISP